MGKLFFWIGALLLVTFAVVNHQFVTVSLWPVALHLTAPLSLFVFFSFALGFFLGFIGKSMGYFFRKGPQDGDI